MTKRELIDGILQFNRTAAPEFLSQFNNEELAEYLDHLRQAEEIAIARGPSPWADTFAYDGVAEYA